MTYAAASVRRVVSTRRQATKQYLARISVLEFETEELYALPVGQTVQYGTVSRMGSMLIWHLRGK